MLKLRDEGLRALARGEDQKTVLERFLKDAEEATVGRLDRMAEEGSRVQGMMRYRGETDEDIGA